MNLDNLVSGGDKYQVFISAGNVPIYMFLTASVVGRQLSQDVNPVHAIGTKKPIATKANAERNEFTISLQDGEAANIIRAMKAVMGEGNIHDFRQFPANTNITVVNLTDASTEKYIGCRFSNDNKNIERQSIETIRELSGVSLDYKSL